MNSYQVNNITTCIYCEINTMVIILLNDKLLKRYRA